MQAGRFIVFEGGEGSGKTTQAKLLYEYLKKEGADVLLTKEPGGDEDFCRDAREILLKPRKSGVSPRAELFIFEGDRAQHVDTVISPALADRKIVISDRFHASTAAYQCGGRGLNFEKFKIIDEFATGGLKPDWTFWLDIDPKIGLQRNVDIQKRDRFEMEDIDFHQRVREGFARYFNNIMGWQKWKKLDGSLPIEELHKQVLETLQNGQLV